MSDDIVNDDVVPATLEEGEVIIPTELVEKYKEAVEEQKAKIEEPVKAEEPEVTKAANVISFDIPKEDKTKKASIGTVNGAIGSSGANKKDKVAPKTTQEVEKVAVFSTRNVTWNGVGKVYRGYNIVTKDEAEQWLKRDHIRLATPEEVAKEFNK